MSISRVAPLAMVLLALWTATGWAQQSEAATVRELARLLGRSFSTAADEYGWTDLHYAAVLNLPRLAATLLDADAEVDAALESDDEWLGYRLRVLRSFRQDDYASVVRIGQTPLHLAAREGSYEVAKLLLDRGADVDGADAAGRTPLYYAASKDAQRAARLLIDHGATLTAAAPDASALHVAAAHDAVGVARLLIRAGAEVDAAGAEGRDTPLHVAAGNDAERVARVLINIGADVRAVNDLGWTPLHVAAARGQPAAATVLLEAGADPNVRDAANRRPGDLATHPVSLVLLGETWPRAPEVEIIRKIDNGLCSSFSRNDFSRLQMRLKNSTRRFLGREMPLEEAYFLIRCNQPLASNLDLIRVSVEIPAQTSVSLLDLLAYFIDAGEKELLGKILSCRREVGGRGCMNVFEHIEKNIERSSRDATPRVNALKEFRQIIDLNLPEEYLKYDQAFCRQFLDEPLHCSGE